MYTRSLTVRLVVLLCAALANPVFIFTADAQEVSYTASFAQSKEAVSVNVLVGQSRVINFDRPIGRFSVSNPEIAEAVLIAPDQVLVNGKGFGQVNFIAWEKSSGQFLVFDVFVRANLSLIDSQMRTLFPKDDIRLSQANGSVVISGTVSDPKTGEQADKVVQAAGFKTVNMLQSPVKNAAQVQLQVRVAEVSRNKMRSFGISYQGTGDGSAGYISNNGPGTLDKFANGVLQSTFGSAMNLFLFSNALNTAAMIQALQKQGALRALAEPNLIAMDGQQASFLAGGEYPIPVVQGSGGGSSGNGVSIMFKEYGVRLNFKPTIIDEDHIRLELEPEVSTLDYGNGVKLQGFTVPALRTRRSKTAIELRDGQSFALAGLLDNNESRSLSKIPVIGDIPVLGALFRSKEYQKLETELVFIVTAQMVKPVNRDDMPQMRGLDGLTNGSPLGVEPKGEGIEGQSGFSTNTNTDTEKNTVTGTKQSAPAAPIAPASTTTTKVQPATSSAPVRTLLPAVAAPPVAPVTKVISGTAVTALQSKAQ